MEIEKKDLLNYTNKIIEMGQSYVNFTNKLSYLFDGNCDSVPAFEDVISDMMSILRDLYIKYRQFEIPVEDEKNIYYDILWDIIFKSGKDIKTAEDFFEYFTTSKVASDFDYDIENKCFYPL